jgi:ESCRT-II complex subunit VPS36
VAAALGVPLPVAGEHLAAAEAAGMLCRDDGPEDVRFFKNFFATAAA